MDGIDLREESGFIDKSYFSDSEPDNNSDIDADMSASINKATEHYFKGIEELCKACIKSKYTRIIKLKKMTPMTQRLQEVHVDL